MKENETLTEVAAQLRQIAQQLEEGIIVVSGMNIAIGNAVKIKLKQKLDRHKVKLDMTLLAEMADQGSEGSRVSLPEREERKGRQRSKERPFQAKKQKKTINGLWKEVAADIGKGSTPRPATAARLLELCDQYGEGADSAWASLWLQCVEEIKKALAAAEDGDFTQAAEAVARIKAQTKQCHKQYK